MEPAKLIPTELAPLLDDRFVRSCALFEEYVQRLSIRVAADLRLEEAGREPGSPAEIAARAGLDPARTAVTVGWLLSMLMISGHATREGDGRFRIPAPLPDLDPREIVDAQERVDTSGLASYRMASLAATLYPQVLRGAGGGEETLFSAERIGAWLEYFSNDNITYAISNRLGAIAAERALPRDGGAVLELGGGLGSGTEACLERLAQTGRLSALQSYRFTELAPSFLRRAQRRLAGRFPGVPLTFGRLDMNRPFSEAEVAAGDFEVVYGVNTLHVAHDLELTLAEVRRALAPGGSLVLSECVRPFRGRPVYVEFLFNLLEAFRAPRLVEPWRPNGGFLTPEQWTAALVACGFRAVTVYPDIVRIRELFPAFIVAAITAVRA